MLIPITWWFVIIWTADSAVLDLDPALHLYPSPPVTHTNDSPAEQLWSERVERNADDLVVIPIEQIQPTLHTTTIPSIAVKLFCQTTPLAAPTISPSSPTTQPSSITSDPLSITTKSSSITTKSSSITTSPSTTEDQESMEKAETFWPSLRSTGYSFGSIHIPLTFSVSGSYGRYGSGGLGPGLGVIGSSYASVADDSGIFGVYGKSGLAGSGYGSYGTRVYGGNGGSAWSGWGNGKWGHYGKG